MARPKTLDISRKTFALTQENIKYVQEYTHETGMSESEFIRRLITQHMNNKNKISIVNEIIEVK